MTISAARRDTAPASASPAATASTPAKMTSGALRARGARPPRAARNERRAAILRVSSSLRVEFASQPKRRAVAAHALLGASASIANACRPPANSSFKASNTRRCRATRDAPCEGIGGDSHAVVRLAAGGGAGVSGMARRIIDDLKRARRENRAQTGLNPGFSIHGRAALWPLSSTQKGGRVRPSRQDLFAPSPISK